MKSQWVDLFPKQILIQHSDRMISNLLAHGLINQGYIVKEQVTIKPGYRLPYIDLMILDSALKKGDGQYPFEEMWSRIETPPILEITNALNPSLSQNVYTKNIVDRIQNPIDFPEMIRKINEIISRDIVGMQQLQVSSYSNAFRVRDIEIYPDRLEIEKKNTLLSLGRMELYIFIQLVQQMGDCISIEQLQEKLRFDTMLATKTIKEHLLKLRKKLNIFQGELEVQNIRNKGYRLVFHNGEGR